MPDFGSFRGFGDKLVQGQTPTQLGLIGSQVVGLLLLNNYPNAAIAYSLRKLDLNYTGKAIRIRRSNNNDELDIGFDLSGNLDTAAISAFCGSFDGLITTWYDQSGFGRNMTQTTSTAQPKIYSLGSLLTHKGLPVISFDGTQTEIITTNFSLVQPCHIFIVNKWNYLAGGAELKGLFDGLSGDNFYYRMDPTNIQIYAGTLFQSPTGRTLNQSLINLLYNSSNSTYFFNSSLVGSYNVGTINPGGLRIGRNFVAGSPRWGNFYMNEFIVYPSVQTTNRLGIETDINTYYAIY
jgi:hypothetical protein